MAGVVSLVYNSVFKRTSTFIAAGVVGAFYFERLCDVITDTIFDNYNRGVSVGRRNDASNLLLTFPLLPHDAETMERHQEDSREIRKRNLL